MRETKSHLSLVKKPTGKEYYVEKHKNDKLVSLNAVDTDEKGNAKIDKAGKPVFLDVIQWNSNSDQIMATWQAIKALLEENIATKGNVILPDDVEATMYLMELIAGQHKMNDKRDYTCQLPVNYMVALCHVLNAAANLTPIRKDKKFKEAVEKLAEGFAVEVEGYRRKKKEEQAMETTPDEVIEKSLVVKGEGYF